MEFLQVYYKSRFAIYDMVRKYLIEGTIEGAIEGAIEVIAC